MREWEPYRRIQITDEMISSLGVEVDRELFEQEFRRVEAVLHMSPEQLRRLRGA